LFFRRDDSHIFSADYDGSTSERKEDEIKTGWSTLQPPRLHLSAKVFYFPLRNVRLDKYLKILHVASLVSYLRTKETHLDDVYVSQERRFGLALTV
jgi:hypothetical protein